MDTIKKSCGCIPQCVNNDSLFISNLCDGSKLDFSTYKYWTEITVPGMIYVPIEKLDIEQLDAINPTVEIIRKQVIKTPSSVDPNYETKYVTGRKIIIEGLICLSVSYVSTSMDQSVNSFHGKVPFSAYIVVPVNPIPGSTVDALNVNFDIIPCLEDLFIQEFCNRNVSLNATLLLQAIPNVKTCYEEEYEEDSGIDCNKNNNQGCCPQEECECDEFQPTIKGVCPTSKIVSLLNDGTKTWTEFFIPEVLNVPTQKPDIEQILSVTSNLDILCQKVINSPEAVANHEGITLTGKKLIIEAVLRQRIVYVSKTLEQSVHSAHFEVPFSIFIVVPKTTKLTDKFKVFPCIEDIFVCALNERQIFKNTTIFIKVKSLTCPQ